MIVQISPFGQGVGQTFQHLRQIGPNIFELSKSGDSLLSFAHFPDICNLVTIESNYQKDHNGDAGAPA
jgi:hypothetical protein